MASESVVAASHRARPGRKASAAQRRRRVGVLAAVVLVVGALAWSPWSSGAEAASPTSSADPASPARSDDAARLVVGAEDTIWDLARTHAPAGTDPRRYVDTVMEANEVDPQRLRAGEVLWLPQP